MLCRGVKGLLLNGEGTLGLTTGVVSSKYISNINSSVSNTNDVLCRLTLSKMWRGIQRIVIEKRRCRVGYRRR
jgi:hypothetical protein